MEAIIGGDGADTLTGANDLVRYPNIAGLGLNDSLTGAGDDDIPGRRFRIRHPEGSRRRRPPDRRSCRRTARSLPGPVLVGIAQGFGQPGANASWKAWEETVCRPPSRSPTS